jgi:hypothetical protein
MSFDASIKRLCAYIESMFIKLHPNANIILLSEFDTFAGSQSANQIYCSVSKYLCYLFKIKSRLAYDTSQVSFTTK